MYIKNRYLCECGLGETIRGQKPKEIHICSKCGAQSEWMWAGEYDDKGCLVKEYAYNGTITEHKTPIKPSKPEPQKPSVTCPYCNSTDCKKLGAISRGVSFGLFGFGSGKIGKQWHCNSCKSDF